MSEDIVDDGLHTTHDEDHKFKCEDLCKTSANAVKVVKLSVPPQNEYEYYSAFPKYKNVLSKLNKQLFNTMNCVLKSEKILTSFHHEQSMTNFDDKYDLMVEANDTILEKVGNLVDEVCGIKVSEPLIKVSVVDSAANWNKRGTNQTPKRDFQRFSCLNWLEKPQEKFDRAPDNSTLPFVAILHEKPNCVKPLSKSYNNLITGKYSEKMNTVKSEPILERKFPFTASFVEEITCHHYMTELEHLVPPDKLLKPVTCTPATELSDSTLRYVDTEAGLNAMMDDLSRCDEIAVDLEAHNHRSFLGFVCLIQISTRELDYIVDSLALRSHLNILNKVFTDPKILKVMHGFDSDVIWLQRDFGVYLVNVFDTGQAARSLNYPIFALSYLLKKYADFDANKQYQLADWRQRPLPVEMIHYARMDTHCLLFIADNMRNALIERGNDAIFQVFDKSRHICMKRFVKPEFTPETYMKLMKTIRKRLSKQQEFVLARLYEWREETARMSDESVGYVLPNHMLIRIAEVLPREAQGILACCNPVPPLVREYLSILHRIILEGKARVFQETTVSINYQSVSVSSLDSRLNQPHDMSSFDTTSTITDSFTDLCLEKPKLNIFGTLDFCDENVGTINSIMSELEHPLAKYLAHMSAVPHFMSSSEREADALSLKSQGQMKIQHRWRLLSHADVLGQHKLQMQLRKMRENPEDTSEDITEGVPVPIDLDGEEENNEVVAATNGNDEAIPILFDDVPAVPAKKLKKDKKRKKRIISHPLLTSKKRKMSVNEDGSQKLGAASDEEDDHPSLLPAKKKKKKIKLPKIKPISDKSAVMKTK